MLRYTFSQSLLASSVFLTTTSVFAALQPIDEAPLSSETEFRCQFNAYLSQAGAKCSRALTVATRKTTV